MTTVALSENPTVTSLMAEAKSFAGLYAGFERYKWYVIAAIVVVGAILIIRRVRRGRAAARA